MGMEMELMAAVKPGTVSTNFGKFKEELALQLEQNYKSIVVSEEGLNFAKDARADLNKMKKQLQDCVKRAKKDNAAPLEIALEQAKELEALLDDAIQTLDVQIKKIEETQGNERMENAKMVLQQMLDHNGDPDVTALVNSCPWAINPKWVNKTYGYTQIRTDCEETIKKAIQALELLQGDFRDQMLQHFRENGDLGAAQILGVQLQKQFDEAEKRKAERLAREAEAKAVAVPEKEEIKIIYADIQPTSDGNLNVLREVLRPTIEVENPDTYKGLGEGYCNATFKICTRRYKMQWLLDLCKAQQIDMVRLDK